jgi:ATP-dependent RNA helicase SUPV3L1/SUV3
MAQDVASSITAVLGPTNTGKTHRAVERMLSHDTGMMGFPLRLLAREVYDRITARIGEREVALVTGEEKRIPQRPRYWVCTVEAMPMGLEVDFLSVDEVQLMSHPERGHVYTDRVLHARGTRETWFLGSDTARTLVERLAPTAKIMGHPRLSRLTSIGQSSLGSLPQRSAVVAFSTTRVYELAERLRQKRGGAAVVLGALSPRARNAQVALYQSGEVDYIVATDAIGMGLNLDLFHVAFADVRKFDGKEARLLEPAELAQIAGRAGRYLNDGTFGTLSPLPALSDSVTRAIESHAFPSETFAYFRNSDLDFASVAALTQSLKVRPLQRYLKSTENADDLGALVQLGERPEIARFATRTDGVKLLWDVCRVPDFRGLLLEFHVGLLSEIFLQLSGPAARIDVDWMAAQVARVDNPEGDIDTLLMRMAAVRTFTYVSHQSKWLADPGEWQERTRTVEDRLSDALHQRLVARFVDPARARRGPPVQRRPRAGAPVSPAIETAPRSDHPFGRLMKLRDELARRQGAVPGAAHEIPNPGDESWIEGVIEAPHARFVVDERGRVHDGGSVVARLTRGSDLLRPEVTVTVPHLRDGASTRVRRRLVAWSRDLVSELLHRMRDESLQALSAAGRGLVYQLERHLGTLRTADARNQVASLTSEDRGLLERAGVRLGDVLVYLPELLTPEATKKRAALVSAFYGASPPLSTAPSLTFDTGLEPGAYTAIGYPIFGRRAIRADVADRIAEVLHGAGGEPFAPLAELAAWLGCSRGELEAIVPAFGYRPIGGGRFVRRAVETA